jgi:uncharacterized phosphatase
MSSAKPELSNSLNSMKTIYFVRHGESEANVKGIMSGHEDDTHLTVNGRLQAKKAGKDLRDKDIQLIVSSPMIRTKDTATIIAETIGYDPRQIITSPLFVEMGFGIYNRRPREEYIQDYEKDKLHESAENTEEMHRRISEGLEWLKNLKENRILLVAHGGVGRVLRTIHQDLHHSKFWEVDKFANTKIYKFTL